MKRKWQRLRQQPIMRGVLVVLLTGLAWAQTSVPQLYPLGTTPKPKAEDYDSHGKVGEVEIGAEYNVHSFGRGDTTYIAPGYLTVEVALYPAKDDLGLAKSFDVSINDFELFLNGKKTPLTPESPYTVAAEIGHPEWHPQEGVGIEASARTPNGGVTLGGPPQPPVIVPGVPPQPPGANSPFPKRDPTDGIERAPRPPATETVVECALVEGRMRSSVSGILYFAYSGKVKAIKAVVLRYRNLELKLR